MSLCACTCGREAGEQTFAAAGCRDRYEQRLAAAVEAAQNVDQHDPALDALKVPTGNCRKVLAVLRRLGKATTGELCQPQVGGTGGVKRIHELKRLGFEIDKQFLRQASYLYTLRSEPGPGAGVPAPAPSRPSSPSGVPNPYDHEFEDIAA